MNWYSKIKSKTTSKDGSPELKRGEVKMILISEFEKHLPDFEFLEYRSGCYTFENIKSLNGQKVYEHLHVIFALKDRNFSCSIASRVNKNYIRSNSYNTGLMNPHKNLIVLKKGTGVIPVEEAYYFHNGQVKTTTKIVNKIAKDFKRYGLPFLNKQFKQLKKSSLIKNGLDFINGLNIEKQLILEKNAVGQESIDLKSRTYLTLKSQLQSIKGIDRETRKEIPGLAYELLDFYRDEK